MMTDIFFYLIIFLFGLTIGSFLNSVIYRLDTGENLLSKRSYCPHCKHILTILDLIPVFSFLILKGKCRYCHQKISWQYPLVELSTGILFLLPLIVRDLISNIWSNLFFYWIFTCFLIIIFVYDLKYYIIPDKIIYPAIGITFLYQLIKVFGLINSMWDSNPPTTLPEGPFRFPTFLNSLSSAFLTGAFFLVILLLSRGKGMGLGDVKLAFLMGLILSFPNILVALFLAFLIGATIGLGLILFGKKTLKSEVPFGPFLVTGTFLALFWGEKLINWYLNLFI